MSQFEFNKHYIKGEVIVREGDPGDRVFKVISGRVLICKGEEKKDYIPLATLNPGDIFGEMHLWDKQKQRSASAVALENTVLAVYYDSEVDGQMMGQIVQQMNTKMNNTTEQFVQQMRIQRQHKAYSFSETRPE